MGRKNCRSKTASGRQGVKAAKGNRSHGGSTLREDGNKAGKGRSKEETADDPIGVHSRLIYPLVRSSLSEEDSSIASSESDEEAESVELTVKPRFVFVASLCAVCLEKSKVVCERCRMVSYCSTTHRAQGLSEHRELCEALTEIRGSIASSLSGESNERLDAERYRVYRVQLLAILRSKIGRPLELWEREIVLYPRVCRICRRFRDEGPICCARCAMESVCEDHSEEHEKWCKEFQVLHRCLVLQYRHGCVEPRIPNDRSRSVIALSEVGFDELMRRIYGNCSYYREMDCYTYSVLSHLCTIPLTALYSMQMSCSEWQSKTDWTIHVLGAEFQFEGVNLHVWEKLFLHFLPNLTRLRLVLVGPELRLPSGVPPELLSKVKLCRGCKSAGRSVLVLFRAETLYHELVRDEPECAIEPNLVCAFNPGLYRKTGFAGKDTWLETIRKFVETPSPVVITSYTADEMLWEMARIKSVGDVEVLLEPRRNPFASIKPDRNFVSDDTNPLIYKNYYIAIVKGKSS